MKSSNNQQRLFSIITVNLNNREGFLKTMTSVFSQTFADFEFIVVDGGSDDGSATLIKNNAWDVTVSDNSSYHNCSWKNYNNKLTGGYFIEPDTGIFHAMNKGIAFSSGEYLLFLNSGDFFIDNTVLEKIFKLDLKEDIVAGDCIVSKNGQFVFHVKPPDQISFQAFYERTLPHQSTFISKELFKKIGNYNEKNFIHSDYEFFIKALIIHKCSYRHLPVTVSDYNLEGLSSSEETKSISNEEIQNIIQHYIPERVVIDYENWAKEQQALKPWYWIKRKPILYKPLISIYNTAKFIVAFKKKKAKN